MPKGVLQIYTTTLDETLLSLVLLGQKAHTVTFRTVMGMLSNQFHSIALMFIGMPKGVEQLYITSLDKTLLSLVLLGHTITFRTVMGMLSNRYFE